MPNQHVWPKVGWHLPGPLVARLKDHAAQSGDTATAIVTAGIEAELDRRDAASTQTP